MSNEVPAGYITMTAGDIRAAATIAIATIKGEEAACKEATMAALLVWRGQERFWWQLWMRLWSVPKAHPALYKWYILKYPWDRPDVPGVPDSARGDSFHQKWLARVRLAADAEKVFIAVDDASALRSWLPNAAPLNEGSAG